MDPHFAFTLEAAKPVIKLSTTGIVQQVLWTFRFTITAPAVPLSNPVIKKLAEPMHCSSQCFRNTTFGKDGFVVLGGRWIKLHLKQLYLCRNVHFSLYKGVFVVFQRWQGQLDLQLAQGHLKGMKLVSSKLTICSSSYSSACKKVYSTITQS